METKVETIPEHSSSVVNSNRIDLLENKRFRSIVKNRKVQFILTAITFVVFTFSIITGLFGTPLGSANFSTIFVWLVWFVVLLSFLVPFMGRFWCTICPIPIVGDTLQRNHIYSNPSDKSHKFGLNKKFPKKYRNLWISNGLFIVFAALAGILTSSPKLTAIVLILFIFTATVFSYIFRGRAFCKYVCPIGGFIGLYSLSSPTELRVKNPDICKSHRTKDCIFGNEEGYGCSWSVYPGKLDRNIDCGLCLECIRTCPYDNVTLNLRPFGSDIYQDQKIDEAFRAIIMTGASVLYLIIFFGPYNRLKELANIGSIPEFILFTVLIFGVLILIFGTFFMLPSKLTEYFCTEEDSQEIFTNFSYSLIPIGLTTWIAFSIQIMASNWIYVINVLNDPFGWGWSNFGIDHLGTSQTPAILTYIIIVLLIFGFIWSLSTMKRLFENYFWNKSEMVVAISIHTLFLVIYTYGLIFILVG